MLFGLFFPIAFLLAIFLTIAAGLRGAALRRLAWIAAGVIAAGLGGAIYAARMGLADSHPLWIAAITALICGLLSGITLCVMGIMGLMARGPR